MLHSTTLSVAINCGAILTSPSVPGTVKYCFCGDEFIRIFMNSFVLNLKLLICFTQLETKICSEILLMIDLREIPTDFAHYHKRQNKILDLFLFACKIFIELLFRRVEAWYYLRVRTFRRWSRSLQIVIISNPARTNFQQISWHFNQNLFLASLIPCDCDIFYCIFGFVLFFHSQNTLHLKYDIW